MSQFRYDAYDFLASRWCERAARNLHAKDILRSTEIHASVDASDKGVSSLNLGESDQRLPHFSGRIAA